MNRRKSMCLLFGLIIFVSVYNHLDHLVDTFYYLKNEFCFEGDEIFPTEFPPKSTQKTNTTRVLLYTNFFNDKYWPYFQNSYHFNPKCGCNFTKFELVHDRTTFLECDIIIFHGRNMPCVKTLTKLHKQRRPQQLWAYFILENPTYDDYVKPVEKFFNMSISYRLDSDVYYPYRRHFPRKQPVISTEMINYAKGKTKQVAWLVSSCGRMRDQLAHKLINYGIKVEVHGKCAKQFKYQFNCASKQCDRELGDFKFYLAAENTLCNDYITEKYWERGINNNAIPIVFGGSNYSNPNLVIPGSFIDAMSLNSVKDLAEYIKEVDNDDDKFNSYFEWKKYWGFEHPNGCDHFYQQLCERMHTRRDRTLSSYINHDECKAKTIFFKSWINR
ncbi:alpha-(1,3)-fucosyltransferase C-like [Hydractinia symbiolongicarpus]|uniref:alpha-(1,3)-fucosyltransferase C-like n=1 Tax=Hydractinia symbiolongicarpus TaxID=13093 RepID=UPI00254E93DC|nr:alpha-(1,3)-fucosyltransferase C-like [Hydractinia symbiolongicarpus]